MVDVFSMEIDLQNIVHQREITNQIHSSTCEQHRGIRG